MSTEIKIPAVGESVSSAVISTWHIKNGEEVSKGDTLLTLETDKISTELTAEADGVLEVLAEEGEEVKIGAVVGKINEGDGKKSKKAAPKEKKSDPETKSGASIADAAEKKEPTGDKQKTKKSRPSKKQESKEAKPEQKEAAPKKSEVSSEGREAESSAEPSKERGDERTTRKPLSPLRRKIAEHLVAAQQNAAILTTFNECDMSEVMELRKNAQETFQKKHGVKLGFMSFFVKAVVAALQEVPSINGRLDGNEFVQNHYYDIGVAVGTDRGLIVPVIRDADRKSFAEIEKDILDYAARAKEGKVTYEDLQGGVFTISNGGIYGSLLSTPILNPPQSGILGMHKIQERPMAVDGRVEIRPMMYLALSYDHRVVDGKEAVTFLVRVKTCLEEPARLLIGI